MKFKLSTFIIATICLFSFGCTETNQSKANSKKKDSLSNKGPKKTIYLRGDSSPLDSGQTVGDTTIIK